MSMLHQQNPMELLELSREHQARLLEEAHQYRLLHLGKEETLSWSNLFAWLRGRPQT